MCDYSLQLRLSDWITSEPLGRIAKCAGLKDHFAYHLTINRKNSDSFCSNAVSSSFANQVVAATGGGSESRSSDRAGAEKPCARMRSAASQVDLVTRR